MAIAPGLRRFVGGFGFAVATLCLPVASRATEIKSPMALGVPTTITLKGDVFHVQGVDVDANFIYVSSVDKVKHRGFLHKFTHAGALVKTADLTEGARYHPGGISLDGGALWVPVAEYKAHSSTRIMQLDTTTLMPMSSFVVRDHIGALALGAGRLYGADWGASNFYTWNRAGKRLARHQTATHVNYQDLKAIAGDLVASGVKADKHSGTIDWLDPQTLLPRERISVGKTAGGVMWSQEGMAIFNSQLYLLPADGQDGHADLYVFDLAPGS